MKPTSLPRLHSMLASIVTTIAVITPSGLQAAWKDNKEADLIIGRQALPSASGLYRPSDVAMSPSGKVYVADYSYHRVLRYSSAAALGNGQAAEAVFGQPDFLTAIPGLSQVSMNGPQFVTVDSSGNLWVSDTENGRVLRWANADNAASGAAAAQVLGHSDFTTGGSADATPTGLNRPVGLATDSTGRLWVADSFSNRILRYNNAAAKGNGGSADGVLGQTDLLSKTSGVTQSKFQSPRDVAVDGSGRLWVCDSSNARVLRFDKAALKANGAGADGVLGQSDYITSSSGNDASHTNRATTIAVSPGGSLFVSDPQNTRIMRWDNAAAKNNGAAADGVLGHLALTPGAGYAPTSGYISTGIQGIFVDGTGRLWATDSYSERVIHWDAAATKPNGAIADGVIGQVNTSNTVTTLTIPSAGVYEPRGGLEDPVSHKVFFADHNRVLRYASRAALESGTAPEAFLGQNNGTDLNGYASTKTMRSAWSIAMDSAGSLWVADYYGNRVVSFPNAATAPTGAAIGVVLGQTNTGNTRAGLSASTLNEPRGLAVDSAGNIYVSDFGNHRVLRFNQVKNKISGSAADAVIGQPDFTTASTLPVAAQLKNPSGICLDAQGRLWVADTGKNRVVRYNAPLAVSPTDPPTGYLGGSLALSPSGMYQPIAVAVTSNGRLWISDSGFNRVLRFDNAASKPDSANADGVLGAPNLNTRYYETRTRSGFYRPEGFFVDAVGTLWVSDTTNARIMKFLPDSSAVITASDINGLGQFNLTFHGVAGTTYQLRSSTDLNVWDLEQTYNLTDALPHSFVNLKSGPRRFFRLEEP